MKNGNSEKTKAPKLTIDRSLDRLNKLPWFQEKLDKANEMLKNVELPPSVKPQS